MFGGGFEKIPKKLATIPPTLSENFPNLTRLSITSYKIPYGIDSFFRRSRFSSLQAFTLHAGPLSNDHTGSFVKFLARHAPTLLELNIPTDIGDVRRRDLDGVYSTPFRLDRVHINPSLFFSLIRRLEECGMLSSVKISHCLHFFGEPFGGQDRSSDYSHRCALLEVFPFVRTLFMGVCLNVCRTPSIPVCSITSAMNVPLKFRDLCKAFPNLQSLYIDVPKEVCAPFPLLLARRAATDRTIS